MLKITDNIKLGKLVGSSGSTGGSGSSNYNDLENKPSINGVSLTGNKTSADLGVLDLNTTDMQFIKSSLVIESGIAITKNNTPMLGLACTTDTVFLSTAEETIKFELIAEDINLNSSPKIHMPTALADLPDNALITKAQVQEMINNALNNS